ncbi:MAG: MazG nucleotide pyrophosphohydrolase domain-containing protein [Candidatus Caldarchaeum sp.]|uniref:Nucleotide pyrophosphohydrolase n=1 Tax=Caldiarchaeum subterraneum TaxID=311458 RepID=A0A7C5YAU7_CALS0
MNIEEAQKLLDEVYGTRDRMRGLDKTFAWLVSEVGELAEAFTKHREPGKIGEEAADVLAWLLSFCNVASIDLEQYFTSKYGNGCPRCGSKPCRCVLR